MNPYYMYINSILCLFDLEKSLLYIQLNSEENCYPETFNDMGEYKCHYKVEDTYYDQRRRWVVKKIVI